MKESVQDRPAAVCVADRPTARESAGTAAKESAESGTRRGAYLRREHRRDLLSLLRQPDGRAQCQLNLLTLSAAHPTFLSEKQRINCEKPYKYSIYQQNSKRKIRKFTTKLQQMKEPDVTTYKEKYRVLRNRHLKEVVFFCAV